MKTNDLVWLGLGGVIAFVVVSKLTSVGKKATDEVAGGIANAYVKLTNWLYGSYAVVPTGNVILPDGTKVPLVNVHLTFDSVNNVGTFVYNGYGYIIRQNPSGGPAYDTNGDYHAE
jgi:hypothetical protein